MYQWLPFVGGTVCLLLAQWGRYVPSAVERTYRNGWFVAWRWAYDSTFAHLPFATILLVLFALSALVARQWHRRILFMYKPWYRGIANLTGWLLMWFYLSWGFNYSAPGVVDKMNWEVNALTGRKAETLRSTAIDEAVLLRSMCDTSRFFAPDVSQRELNVIHASLRDALQAHGFKTPGSPAMRLVSRSGWMRRIGVSGIYLPFSSECHADRSYPPLILWFTIAHEFAHGYGVTDEGECNYLAFVALLTSGMAELEYAAWFSLIGDLSNRERLNDLPMPIARDWAGVRHNYENHPPLIPGIANFMNHVYLKSQGVKEGITSYGMTPRLVVSAADAGHLDVKKRELLLSRN